MPERDTATPGSRPAVPRAAVTSSKVPAIRIERAHFLSFVTAHSQINGYLTSGYLLFSFPHLPENDCQREHVYYTCKV
jgi:hypothetical protein